MSYDTLTKEQKLAIDEVGGDLERAFDSARAKLAAARFVFDPDSTGCTQCSCQGYRGPGPCKTEGCHHSIGRHPGVF